MTQLADIAEAALEALRPKLPAGARTVVLIEGPLHSCGGRPWGAALSESFNAQEVGAIMTALANRDPEPQ
jgi:hypothetical protein